MLSAAPVDGSRSGRKLSAISSSSASAIVIGSGSATAHSTSRSFTGSNSQAVANAATIKGGQSTAVADSTAADGASVSTTSSALAVDGATAGASTTATGAGSDTVIDATNDVSVSGNATAIVDLTITLISDGKTIEETSKELEIYLENADATIFTGLLTQANTRGGDVLEVITRAMELVLEKKGCEEFKELFLVDDYSIFAKIISPKLDDCLLVDCTNTASATYCCGDAQTHQGECNCSEGKCLWHISRREPYPALWRCDFCGPTPEFCRCTITQ